MENIGALAILLAFCFAVYAVIGSLVGKWAKRPFLVLSAQRAVYCVWALLTCGRRNSPLFVDQGRLPHGLRVGYQQPHNADAVQSRGLVGRPGRLAPVMVLAALDLRRRSSYSRTAASSAK